MALFERAQAWLRRPSPLRRSSGEPRPTRLLLETLETRDLLSASNPIGSLALSLPSSTTSSTPTATITWHPAKGSASIEVNLDVDLNHDGKFGGHELGYTRVLVHAGVNTVTLPKLTPGTYEVRARIDNWSLMSSVVDTTITAPPKTTTTTPPKTTTTTTSPKTTGTTTTTPPKTTTTVTPKANPNQDIIGDENVLKIMQAYQNAGNKLTPAILKQFHLLEFDAADRLGVEIRSTSDATLTELSTALINAGMKVALISTKQDVIVGYLAVGSLKNLVALPGFAAVIAIYKPIVSTGSVESQGDGVIKGPQFRSTTGDTGQGVTVAAISDSVSQVSPGIAGSQSTGDLPPNVTVVQDGNPGDTDEGRAMLEIIYDVAPGANLAFATGDGGALNFANNIQNLISIGARVITDDLSYFDEPMFNDGVIAQEVDSATAQGVFYTSAAGNNGNNSWSDTYRPVTATVGGITGSFENFNATGATQVLQSLTIPAGGELTISFQWDDAFLEGGSNQPNFQVPTEMDALLTDSTGTTLLADANNNSLNTNEAVQVLDFTNNSATALSANLSFFQAQGPAPGILKWVAEEDGAFDLNAYKQGNTPAIFGHQAAATDVATAAAFWGTPTTVESYSNLGGPISILFDDAGNRLATPSVRFKPDVTGPDGVDTSFFGQPADPSSPDQNPEFFGTSAATPHVAGAAALLMSQDPSATNTFIVNYLEQTALDINTPGLDDLTGYGLIQLTPINTAVIPITGDVTGYVNYYRPLRYTYDAATQTYDGNITIINTSQFANIGVPLTVVLPTLPSGVTVANATGVSDTGAPEITVNVGSVPIGQPIRFEIMLKDPLGVPLSTIFTGYQLLVIAQ